VMKLCVEKWLRSTVRRDFALKKSSVRRDFASKIWQGSLVPRLFASKEMAKIVENEVNQIALCYIQTFNWPMNSSTEKLLNNRHTNT